MTEEKTINVELVKRNISDIKLILRDSDSKTISLTIEMLLFQHMFSAIKSGMFDEKDLDDYMNDLRKMIRNNIKESQETQ